MQAAAEIINVPSIDLPGYLSDFFSFITGNAPVAFEFTKSFFGILIGISAIVSVLFILGILFAVEGIKSVRRKEDEIYNTKVVPAYTSEHASETKVEEELGKRWDNILNHINSANQNDWKQAIIEADIILDDLLNKLGYKGESIGEKLKRVAKGDFKTIDEAWEAHKVRNAIAHDAGFALNEIEAKRTIGLYRKIFEEFYHIK